MARTLPRATGPVPYAWLATSADFAAVATTASFALRADRLAADAESTRRRPPAPSGPRTHSTRSKSTSHTRSAGRRRVMWLLAMVPRKSAEDDGQ